VTLADGGVTGSGMTPRGQGYHTYACRLPFERNTQDPRRAPEVGRGHTLISARTSGSIAGPRVLRENPFILKSFAIFGDAGFAR